MTRLRRLITPFRDLSLAFLAALMLLAGVAQARMATEAAGKAHFAGGFALCLQSGLSGESPDPDHDCDQCRLPGAVDLPSLPQAASQPVSRVAEAPPPLSRPGLSSAAPLFRPEARGPPALA